MIDDAPNTEADDAVQVVGETGDDFVSAPATVRFSDIGGPVTRPVEPPSVASGPVAIVLEHTGPYLLTPPYVEGTLMCWPLDRWNAPAGVAAVLLDPETHKVLGARWRPWREGDEPSAETAAQMAAQSPAAKRARRCCGK